MLSLLTPTAGRDPNGRFAPGNPGGPGNPNAKQVAQLKAALLICLTAVELVAIFKALIEKAKEGNMQAIKMVLNYAIGKPMPMGLAAGLDAFEEVWSPESGVGCPEVGEGTETDNNGQLGTEADNGQPMETKSNGEEVRCPESGVGSPCQPPDLTPDSGHQTPDILQPMETEVNGGGKGSGVTVQGSEAPGQPSVTGVNGGGKGSGVGVQGSGAVKPPSAIGANGQKLNRRELRRLERAAKKAGVPFKAR